MTPPPAVRETVRRLTAMSTERSLVLGLVLAVLSLGLPWSPADRRGSASLFGLPRFSVDAGVDQSATTGPVKALSWLFPAAAPNGISRSILALRRLSSGADLEPQKSSSIAISSQESPSPAEISIDPVPRPGNLIYIPCCE